MSEIQFTVALLALALAVVGAVGGVAILAAKEYRSRPRRRRSAT